MTPELAQAQHDTCNVSEGMRHCLTCAFAPKKHEPPTCPVHKCTMYFGGYGWICPLCEREIRHQEEMDILEREVRETHEAVRPGLW